MSIKRLWRFPKCWSSLILLMTCRQKKRKEIFFSYVCGHLCGKERKKFFRKNVNLWFFSVNIMIAVVIGKQSFMNQDFVDDNHTHTHIHTQRIVVFLLSKSFFEWILVQVEIVWIISHVVIYCSFFRLMIGFSLAF